MSQYSETLGSFLRNGNFPLEADYIFSSEEALKEFYSNPTRKVTLHKGLLKVVAQDNKQILYWVVQEGEELQFTKLIEANSISEIQASLDDLIEALIQEIQDRKDAINEVYGTDNPTELPEQLSNIKKIIEALQELQNTVAYKEELKAVVGTEQDNIPNYLSTLDYQNITQLSEKLADFLKGQDPEITLREVQQIIKNRIDNLQRELDTTQAGVGLNGDGSFDQINMKNTTYLDGTTSVIEALKALDREMSTLVVDAFIQDAYYDTTTEEIVLTFITKQEKTKTIRISMANLIREWEPDNTNSDRVVELYREEVRGGGADKLSADVRLSTSPNNILEKDGNTLLVDGTPIKELDEAVSNEVNRAKLAEQQLQSQLDNIQTSIDTVIKDAELDVVSTESIELSKEIGENNRNQLSAKTRIAILKENILEQTTEGLLVRGTSDNITHKGESLEEFIERLDSAQVPVYENMTHALQHESKEGSIFLVSNGDNLGEKGFYTIVDEQPTRVAFTSELKKAISDLRDEIQIKLDELDWYWEE